MPQWTHPKGSLPQNPPGTSHRSQTPFDPPGSPLPAHPGAPCALCVLMHLHTWLEPLSWGAQEGTWGHRLFLPCVPSFGTHQPHKLPLSPGAQYTQSHPPKLPSTPAALPHAQADEPPPQNKGSPQNSGCSLQAVRRRKGPSSHKPTGMGSAASVLKAEFGRFRAILGFIPGGEARHGGTPY